jgi:hypothetical protein
MLLMSSYTQRIKMTLFAHYYRFSRIEKVTGIIITLYGKNNDDIRKRNRFEKKIKKFVAQ